MNEMGWSFQELMETPYETYLDISRIISLENKEELKEQKKAEREMK